VLLMICCFCLLSVGTRNIKKMTSQIKHRNASGALRNRVGGDVRDQAWTLDWDTMEFAQPLHVEVCTVSLTIILPSTWCLDLCSHISLKKTTCCVCIPAPWCKTR
jgi:hypothetical protein